MKSTERRHLKQDPLAATLQGTYQRLDRNRKHITLAMTLLVVVLLALGGWVWWRNHAEARASGMFAEAMVVAESPVGPGPVPDTDDGTPAAAPQTQPGTFATERERDEAAVARFLEAADAYPNQQPGIAARYHAAATLVSLGRDAEAAEQYQQVIDRAGRHFYARVARLGLAEVQVRQNQFDPAIATYQELITTAKDDLPVDGILIQLGRAYRLAGREAEAQQAFKRVVDEFPTSPFAAEAQRELGTTAPAGA
jgi:TolA-binding protein